MSFDIFFSSFDYVVAKTVTKRKGKSEKIHWRNINICIWAYENVCENQPITICVRVCVCLFGLKFDWIVVGLIELNGLDIHILEYEMPSNRHYYALCVCIQHWSNGCRINVTLLSKLETLWTMDKPTFRFGFDAFKLWAADSCYKFNKCDWFEWSSHS